MSSMTKLDDKERIRGARYDEAELRKQCLEGNHKYLVALIPRAICRRQGEPHDLRAPETLPPKPQARTALV